jgi:glycosyltransferase involved in cell wall biosynthesis
MKRGISLEALRVIKDLKKIFEREQFDIVQYSTPNAAFYASIASKWAGIKNRLYCQWGIRYMGYDKGLKHSVFKIIEKITCQFSTIIESESFSLYDFSVNEKLYPKDKASVIWKGSACGVDLSRYDYNTKSTYRKVIRERMGIPQDAFLFGYTGRLTGDKGINELILAFKELGNLENAYLLLVGSFDDEKTLNPDLMAWAQKNKHIIFAGQRSNVEQFYCAMDVFMSLSYREGFGLVVIEAASMGVPGIVTNVPGQKDTIINSETGFSVPVKNTIKVKETMEYCIKNPLLIKNMGKHARKFVEENFEQQELFRQLAAHRDQILCSVVDF